MARKNILYSLLVVVLVIAGTAYWQVNKRDVAILEGIKIDSSKTTQKAIDWDNMDQVFSIKAPDDFDAAKLGRLEEKITNAKNLYQIKKSETWTWVTIGNMYEFVRDYDRAIGAYEKVATINNLEYISQMNLAYIYENQKKDYTKAEGYYKKVIELNGTNPEQYINLARLYEFKMNRNDEAEKVYLDGLNKTSNNPDLFVPLIRFYERNKNTEKMNEYAEKLLKLYPDNEAYKNDFGALIK